MNTTTTATSSDVGSAPAEGRITDQAIADAALKDHAEPYRRLDTGVLEVLVLVLREDDTAL